MIMGLRAKNDRKGKETMKNRSAKRFVALSEAISTYENKTPMRVTGMPDRLAKWRVRQRTSQSNLKRAQLRCHHRVIIAATERLVELRHAGRGKRASSRCDVLLQGVEVLSRLPASAEGKASPLEEELL